MSIPIARTKPSPQRLQLIKTLITVCAFLATLIGASAFTSGPEAVIDSTPSTSVSESLFGSGTEAAIDALTVPALTESLEAVADAFITPVMNSFRTMSVMDSPCASALGKE